MTYIISFTSEAKKSLTKVKKSNAKLWKKVERLLLMIELFMTFMMTGWLS